MNRRKINKYIEKIASSWLLTRITLNFMLPSTSIKFFPQTSCFCHIQFSLTPFNQSYRFLCTYLYKYPKCCNFALVDVAISKESFSHWRKVQQRRSA